MNELHAKLSDMERRIMTAENNMSTRDFTHSSGFARGNNYPMQGSTITPPPERQATNRLQNPPGLRSEAYLARMQRQVQRNQTFDRFFEGILFRKESGMMGTRTWCERFARLEGLDLVFYSTVRAKKPKDRYPISSATFVERVQGKKKSNRFEVHVRSGDAYGPLNPQGVMQLYFEQEETANRFVDIVMELVYLLNEGISYEYDHPLDYPASQPPSHPISLHNSTRSLPYAPMAPTPPLGAPSSRGFGLASTASLASSSSDYVHPSANAPGISSASASSLTYPTLTHGAKMDGGAVSQVLADLAMSQTAFGPGLYEAQRGVPAQFTIQAFDAHGTRRTVGGDLFSVSYSPAADPDLLFQSTPVDNGDGTYTVEYTPSRKGTWVLHVLFEGCPIYGSPFYPEVRPASTSALHCEIQGVHSKFAVPGTRNCFTIVAKDGFGERKEEGGDIFTVHVAKGPAFVSPIWDEGDGSYSLTYEIDTSCQTYLDALQRLERDLQVLMEPAQNASSTASTSVGGQRPPSLPPAGSSRRPGTFTSTEAMWDVVESQNSGDLDLETSSFASLQHTAEDAQGAGRADSRIYSPHPPSRPKNSAGNNANPSSASKRDSRNLLQWMDDIDDPYAYHGGQRVTRPSERPVSGFFVPPSHDPQKATTAAPSNAPAARAAAPSSTSQLAPIQETRPTDQHPPQQPPPSLRLPSSSLTIELSVTLSNPNFPFPRPLQPHPLVIKVALPGSAEEALYRKIAATQPSPQQPSSPRYHTPHPLPSDSSEMHPERLRSASYGGGGGISGASDVNGISVGGPTITPLYLGLSRSNVPTPPTPRMASDFDGPEFSGGDGGDGGSDRTGHEFAPGNRIIESVDRGTDRITALPSHSYPTHALSSSDRGLSADQDTEIVRLRLELAHLVREYRERLHILDKEQGDVSEQKALLQEQISKLEHLGYKMKNESAMLAQQAHELKKHQDRWVDQQSNQESASWSGPGNSSKNSPVKMEGDTMRQLQERHPSLPPPIYQSSPQTEGPTNANAANPATALQPAATPLANPSSAGPSKANATATNAPGSESHPPGGDMATPPPNYPPALAPEEPGTAVATTPAVSRTQTPPPPPPPPAVASVYAYPTNVQPLSPPFGRSNPASPATSDSIAAQRTAPGTHTGNTPQAELSRLQVLYGQDAGTELTANAQILHDVWNYYSQLTQQDEVSVVRNIATAGVSLKRFYTFFSDYDLTPTFVSKKHLRSIFESIEAGTVTSSSTAKLPFSAFVQAVVDACIFALEKPPFHELYPTPTAKIQVLLHTWWVASASKLQEIKEKRERRYKKKLESASA